MHDECDTSDEEEIQNKQNSNDKSKEVTQNDTRTTYNDKNVKHRKTNGVSIEDKSSRSQKSKCVNTDQYSKQSVQEVDRGHTESIKVRYSVLL